MHMGVENDITCSFCKKKERDAVNHIFWRCASIRPIWEQLQMAINDRDVNAVSITLNESIVLFGHDVNFRSDDTFNLIMLVAIVFIYKCKVKKFIPQFHFFKQYLRNTFEVYKHNSKVNKSHSKFMNSWNHRIFRVVLSFLFLFIMVTMHIAHNNRPDSFTCSSHIFIMHSLHAWPLLFVHLSGRVC